MVNWPGLLSWSTKYHDGTAPSNFHQMSREDKDFLQRAMEDMFASIEDPNKIFKEAIDKIRDAPTDEQALTTLEIIDRCCDDPDVARNIEVHDGLTPLLALVDNANANVVARACEVLALIIANNPPIQVAASKKIALQKLMVVTSDANDVSARGKLRLLSTIVRNVEELEKEFVTQDGVQFLGRCMTSNNEKIATRAASLLTHLIFMERCEATTATASYCSKAIVAFKDIDMQGGDILVRCASVNKETKSKAIIDALKERIKVIHQKNDVSLWKEDLDQLARTLQEFE